MKMRESHVSKTLKRERERERERERSTSAYHDFQMIGRSPIKWRHRPDMSIAIECDVLDILCESENRTYSMKVSTGSSC